MAGTKAGAAARRERSAPHTPPASAAPETPLPETVYAVGRRPLNYEGVLLQPGDPVPGAERWTRVESWERAGLIVKR